MRAAVQAAAGRGGHRPRDAGVADRRASTSTPALRAAGSRPAARRRARCCPPGPGTTPGCWPRARARRRCSSSATRPGSRTRPPSTRGRGLRRRGGRAGRGARATSRAGDRVAGAEHGLARRRRCAPGDVLIDARRRPVHRGRRPASRARPRATRLAGPHPAGAGERPLARLPPGAARADPRGRRHFWTWREQMYAVAARLDPDGYLALARAVYAEMALAGVTGVGEFHYLHHGPDGRPYDDPNAMGRALAQAAAEAGIRLTLLDTCYLRRRDRRRRSAGRAAAVRRRRRRARGRRGSRPGGRPAGAGRGGGALGPRRPAGRLRRSSPAGPRARRAAARAPVRAAGGERGVPGRATACTPDGAARRARARPARASPPSTPPT